VPEALLLSSHYESGRGALRRIRDLASAIRIGDWELYSRIIIALSLPANRAGGALALFALRVEEGALRRIRDLASAIRIGDWGRIYLYNAPRCGLLA